MADDFTSLLGAISGGASASPAGAGLGVAGIGLEAFGAYEAYSAAKDYTNTVNPLYQAKATQDISIARSQQNIESINQQYMELTNQRARLQNLRNAQQAASEAQLAATNAGASYGSGIAGQIGTISSEAGRNAQGLSQGLEMGRNIFAQNMAISNARVNEFGITSQLEQAEANYKTKQSTASGLASVGGSLLKGASLFI